MAESLRLFLVEDNDDIAFVTRLCLERAGHHVTVCHTGADALLVLGHSTFDLAILDYILQDMKGSELLARMQQDGNRTPVLLITAYGDQQLAAQVLRDGALDYVARDQTSAYLAELPLRVVEAVAKYRLRQTNNLFTAAVESARDGIVITDLQGIVLHVNTSLEEMFGFTRAELVGQNASQMFHRPGQPAGSRTSWPTMHDRRSWQGELVSQRKDGTLIDTSLTISPIFDARGQMTHFVGIYRDITDRKQMERQLVQAQKMQSVGTLAGGVAHEFNNLLAGIHGYASLGLREQDLPRPVREFLDLIVGLTDRAAHLTRQLLAFARKPSLAQMPTDLARLLEGTRDLVQRSLNIEVALEIEVPPDGTGWCTLADANQLQQVLVNLCLNARDAMPKPLPAPVVFRLTHRVFAGEQPAFPQNVAAGEYYVIEVQDQGVGMTADVLAQALDPFFTTKEAGQGTGLGLPVAFGIMTGHRGQLTIDSEPGKGTRIGLYLPRVSQQLTASATPGVAVLEPEASTPRNILVVDDEEAVLDVIRRFLEIAGHHVACARSGQQALDRLAQNHVDLIVLDWMIPKEDGRRNVQSIRAARPQVPIVLCTGLVQADQAAELVQAGAVELLRKPFRMNELWHVVNNSLQRNGQPAG